MVWLDQGDWSRAEEEAQEICSRTYAAETYRFPALIALARLRIRRGDQDAETPLDAARRLAAAMAEPQRTVYVAMMAAEEAWLLHDRRASATSSRRRRSCEMCTDGRAAQFTLGGGGFGAVAAHAGRARGGNRRNLPVPFANIARAAGSRRRQAGARSAVPTRRRWP